LGEQNEPVGGIKDVWIDGDMESLTQRGGRDTRKVLHHIKKKKLRNKNTSRKWLKCSKIIQDEKIY